MKWNGTSLEPGLHRQGKYLAFVEPVKDKSGKNKTTWFWLNSIGHLYSCTDMYPFEHRSEQVRDSKYGLPLQVEPERFEIAVSEITKTEVIA